MKSTIEYDYINNEIENLEWLDSNYDKEKEIELHQLKVEWDLVTYDRGSHADQEIIIKKIEFYVEFEIGEFNADPQLDSRETFPVEFELIPEENKDWNVEVCTDGIEGIGINSIAPESFLIDFKEKRIVINF